MTATEASPTPLLLGRIITSQPSLNNKTRIVGWASPSAPLLTTMMMAPSLLFCHLSNPWGKSFPLRNMLQHKHCWRRPALYLLGLFLKSLHEILLRPRRKQETHFKTVLIYCSGDRAGQAGGDSPQGGCLRL